MGARVIRLSWSPTLAGYVSERLDVPPNAEWVIDVIPAVLTPELQGRIERALYDAHCTLRPAQYAALARAALLAAGFVPGAPVENNEEA
jgi:hypothetical protein